MLGIWVKRLCVVVVSQWYCAEAWAMRTTVVFPIQKEFWSNRTTVYSVYLSVWLDPKKPPQWSISGPLWKPWTRGGLVGMFTIHNRTLYGLHRLHPVWQILNEPENYWKLLDCDYWRSTTLMNKPWFSKIRGWHYPISSAPALHLHRLTQWEWLESKIRSKVQAPQTRDQRAHGCFSHRKTCWLPRLKRPWTGCL